jgi:hypothetical protein
MRRTLLTAALLILPSIAFALDYDDLTDRYSDAPFSTAEAAGISVLTEIGAVSGNPDGSFAAERTLNRAEFLKIALLSANQNPEDLSKCFPDAPAGAWFTSYICTAKALGVVEGNPDGLFHPERPVNYAEALKMLAELYEYDLPEPAENERWAWYTPYLRATEEKGVALPASVEPAHELTRGQMARLAAAFVAEDEGELAGYRAFEKGQSLSSSSSSQSTSSSVSSSSSVFSSSSQSSSSSSSSLALNAQSHFLVVGTTTPVLYDALIQATEEVRVQSVELELYREIRSLESLVLIDEKGTQIATLSLQTYSNANDTKWRADFSSGGYVIPGNIPIRIGITARIKTVVDGAASKELLEFKNLQIFTVGTQSSVSQQIAPTDIHHPSHQTAFGRVTGVKSTVASSATVQQGTQRQFGSFELTAFLSSGATVKATSLVFELQTTDTSVKNLKIGTTSAVQQSDCASEIENGKTFITCFIPESMQSLSSTPVALSIFGDVTVAAAKQTGTVQLVSRGPGGIGQLGMVNWTDGSGIFNWTEADVRVDSGPLVTVTK